MRLIDADDLISLVTEQAETEVDKVIASVCRGAALSMPTIDPVHAAGGCYCRECKHAHINEYASKPSDIFCKRLTNKAEGVLCFVSPYDFCSYGEKEEKQ